MIDFRKEMWEDDYISNKNDVRWLCTDCGKGQIKLTDSFKSKNQFSAARCKCTNCKNSYLVTGKVMTFAGGTNVSKTYYRIDDYRLYPTHIQPTLALFQLPDALNPVAKRLIQLSFNHFWFDLDACANKIRQGIEVLVNEKGGKGNTLDNRINSLKKSLDIEITNRLLALKHIGNEGSHIDDYETFTKKQILETYAILCDLLDTLYPENNQEEKEALIKKINENKGIKKI